MVHRVWIDTVSEQFVAAVPIRVSQPEIASAFREPIDKVLAFLRKHDGLRTDGDEVFIYRNKDDPSEDGKMNIEIGVQVTRSFTGEGDVICTSTPAGRAATTIHIGPYSQLVKVHSVVQQWCRANGHELAAVDWEIYGDWNDDQTKLESRVCYLLR